MSMISFDTINALGRDGMDAAMRSATALTSGLQAVAAETADFSKGSFERGSQTVERLFGARSFDTVAQIQGEFVRASYERTVAQFGRMTELSANTAKEVAAPIEALLSKASRAA